MSHLFSIIGRQGMLLFANVNFCDACNVLSKHRISDSHRKGSLYSIANVGSCDEHRPMKKSHVDSTQILTSSKESNDLTWVC